MSANVGRMFYEGAVPWHGLGKKVEKSLTWAEAIVEAGLDWTVGKAEVEFTVKGAVQSFDGKSVTYREDTRQSLGIVGSGYTIVQNKQAGQVLDAVIGETGAHYHTAGYLGKGEKVWMLIKLPGVLRVVGDDVVEKYLLCSNGHDGMMAFWILETPIRVVCQNTLMAAIGQKGSNAFREVHSADMTLDVKSIREKLGYAKEKFDVLEQAYQKMAKTTFKAAGVREYFRDVILYPDPILGDGSLDGDDKASTRMKNRLNDLLSLYEGGKGTEIKGVKGTVWGAYNAVAEYADYFNGKNNESRARSTLFGSGAQMKSRAFSLALELAK